MKRKLFVAASVLAVAACSPASDPMSDELKKDLDVAASSDGLSMASDRGQAQQVVSAIEQSPPAPKKVAASQRSVRRRPVRTGTPAPVETEAASPVDENEDQSVDIASVAMTDDAPVAPRPTPVITSLPGGRGEGRAGSGVGVDVGIAVGTIIGVVLRGGSVGEDHCEAHDRRRAGRRPVIAVNNRIPVLRGTFPGRVGGGR